MQLIRAVAHGVFEHELAKAVHWAAMGMPAARFL